MSSVISPVWCESAPFIRFIQASLISLQDLVKDLKSELTGNFENVMVSLMRPRQRFDAISLRKAMKVSQ